MGRGMSLWMLMQMHPLSAQLEEQGAEELTPVRQSREEAKSCTHCTPAVHGNANHVLKPIHTIRLGEAAWSLRLQPPWNTMWGAQTSCQSIQYSHLHAGSVRICWAWHM